MTLLSYPRPPRLRYAAPMRNEPLSAPPFSSTALYLFGHLRRRGGSMRIGPLLWDLKLQDNLFADAINELQERGWIKVTWRKDGAPLPANVPARFAPCQRITTTRFGRWRYSVTWPTRTRSRTSPAFGRKGTDNAALSHRAVRLALLHPVSRNWKGRWQRKISLIV